MYLSALQCALRRTLAVVLAGSLTATAWSQTATQPDQSAPEGPKPQRFTLDYTKARSHFPNPTAPYRPQYLQAPDLSNTPRIEQLLRSRIEYHCRTGLGTITVDHQRLPCISQIQVQARVLEQVLDMAGDLGALRP